MREAHACMLLKSLQDFKKLCCAEEKALRNYYPMRLLTAHITLVTFGAEKGCYHTWRGEGLLNSKILKALEQSKRSKSSI